MAINPKKLTVDYKDIIKGSSFAKGGSPSTGNRAALSLLSPTDLAGNFPSYGKGGGSGRGGGGDASSSSSSGSSLLKGLSRPNSAQSLGGTPRNRPSGGSGSPPNSSHSVGGTPRNNRPATAAPEKETPWERNMREGTVPASGGTPGNIDRSHFGGELSQKEKDLMYRAAWMVKGEGNLDPKGNLERQRIQFRSAVDRAQIRGHSLERGLWDGRDAVANGQPANRGYYDGNPQNGTYRERARPTPEELKHFEENIWRPIIKEGKDFQEGKIFTGNASAGVAERGKTGGEYAHHRDIEGETFALHKHDAGVLKNKPLPIIKDTGQTAIPAGTKPNTIEGKMQPWKIEDIRAAVDNRQQTATAEPLAPGQSRIGHEKGNYEMNGIKLNEKLQNVMNEAAKDLPEGYTIKMTSGVDARSTGTTNHPNGLAMDVRIFDKNGKALPNNQNSPGWKEYEKLYRSVHIRGKEMYPDEKFIWGGAWQGRASGNGDPMHYQIVKPVPGSSQGMGSHSGEYSFDGGLSKSHDFYKSGYHLNDDERKAYDTSIRDKLIIERKAREEKREQQQVPPNPPRSAGTPARPVGPTATPEPPKPKQEYNYRFDRNSLGFFQQQGITEDGRFNDTAKNWAPSNEEFQKLSPALQKDLLSGMKIEDAVRKHHQTLTPEQQKAAIAEAQKHGVFITPKDPPKSPAPTAPKPATTTPMPSAASPTPATPAPTSPSAPSSTPAKSPGTAEPTAKKESPLPKAAEPKKEETKKEDPKESAAAPDEAYGGQINKIADPSKLSAIPLGGDKRGTSGREDTALLYNNKVQAYVNRNEGMKYDSDRNKLDITPTQRTQADNLLEKRNEAKRAPEPKPEPRPENKVIMKAHADLNKQLKEDIMHPPTSNWGNQSTERAYTRSKFYEPGDHIAGYHFNSGASNFRSS